MSTIAPVRLYPICEKRLWGYINASGEVVVEPRFSDAQPFSDGLGAVSLSGLRGFVDGAGATVIEPRWGFARSFSEGLTLVGEKLKTPLRWSVIDRRGEVVFSGVGDPPGEFSCGLATASVPPEEKHGARLHGYLDRLGSWAIAPRYRFAVVFREGLGVVRDAETMKYGFIDPSGAWVIPPRYGDAGVFSEGLAAVFSGPPEHSVEYIDRSGETRLRGPMAYLAAGQFSEGLAWFPWAEDSFARGYMDATGREVIAPRRGLGADFSDGRAVAGSGPFGYIDRTGAEVVPLVLARADAFAGGLARVHPDPRKPAAFGYIDVNGRWVWQPRGRPFPELPSTSRG